MPARTGRVERVSPPVDGLGADRRAPAGAWKMVGRRLRSAGAGGRAGPFGLQARRPRRAGGRRVLHLGTLVLGVGTPVSPSVLHGTEQSRRFPGGAILHSLGEHRRLVRVRPARSRVHGDRTVAAVAPGCQRRRPRRARRPRSRAWCSRRWRAWSTPRDRRSIRPRSRRCCRSSVRRPTASRSTNSRTSVRGSRIKSASTRYAPFSCITRCPSPSDWRRSS